MARTSQGGSILGFLIVGSVLALLLIGGAYFVRNNLADPDATTDRVARQDGENGGEGDESNPEDRNGQVDEDEQDDQPGQNNSDDQPVRGDDDNEDADEVPEETDEETLPVTGNSDDNPTPGALPQTGPADVFASSLMFGLLAALVVRYKRSRNMSISL